MTQSLNYTTQLCILQTGVRVLLHQVFFSNNLEWYESWHHSYQTRGNEGSRLIMGQVVKNPESTPLRVR